MARVLICHVPKDGTVARELGAALMGRGHFVSFDGEPDTARDDRSARLRHFDAVVVVWTDTSAPSVGLTDIAREMLPLNLLVPVRTEDLDVARLPLTFRKLNMMSPRDFDGLARVINRLSTAASSMRELAERDAPAKQRNAKPAEPDAGIAKAAGGTSPERPAVRETSPYRAPPGGKSQKAASSPAAPPARAPMRALSDLPEVDVDPSIAAHRQAKAFSAFNDRSGQRPATADDLGRAIDAGLLMLDVPAVLRLNVPTLVEFTLGAEYLTGAADPAVPQGTSGTAQAIETLSISLLGDDQTFQIERKSERTQFVMRQLALPGEVEGFGRWKWVVTARSIGSYHVIVRISALLRDGHGVPSPVALPDRRVTVRVEAETTAGAGAAPVAWYRR